MAVRHDRLTGLQTRSDDGFRRRGPVHDDVTHLDRLIRLHHEHEGPLLARLYGLRRHHSGVLFGREFHGHVPVHGPATGVDPLLGNVPFTLIVPVDGSTELSMKEIRPVAGAASSKLGGVASTRSAPRAKEPFQLGQARLGNRERHLNRHDPVDHHERRAVGAHQVALTWSAPV